MSARWWTHMTTSTQYVSIHGINETMVREQPCFAERHTELSKFTAGAVTVCHTHFDRVALAQACAAGQHAPLGCR